MHVTDYHQLDWDGWRAKRATMTDDEQRAFHIAVANASPVQKDFNEHAFAEFFSNLPPNVKVLEIGGWDGELASVAHWKFPPTTKIDRWYNCEFSPVEPCPSARSMLRYRHVCPEKYRWWDDPGMWYVWEGSSVLVASHVFEHLLGAEIETILKLAKDVKDLYVDFPCTEYRQSWYGYGGTHCVDIGWRDLHKMITEQFGYTCIGFEKTARWYIRT